MPFNEVVPEIDVLIAAATWLWARRIAPLRVSIPVAAGRSKWEDRRRLTETFDSIGVPKGSWHTVSDGPDIEARSAQQHWRVECKGAGTGVQQTQRNNFDRALASVVSYYEDLSSGVENVLALAIPRTHDYVAQLRNRIRQPLRKCLNLWILIYDPSSQQIQAVGPEEDYTW